MKIMQAPNDGVIIIAFSEHLYRGITPCYWGFVLDKCKHYSKPMCLWTKNVFVEIFPKEPE